MAGVRHKLLHFFRDNAIALGSFSIAVMGLYLTITAQREERAHKELLLRPVLMLDAQVSNYSVAIANHGLGPALITDALYYFDGRCHAVSNMTMDEIVKTDAVKVTRAFGNYFVQQFEAVKWKDGWKSPPGVRTGVPFPSQIVAVGQEITIFGFEPEGAKAVSSRLFDLGYDTLDAFNDEFVTRAFSMPLSLRYCSMSEQYCSIGGGRFGISAIKTSQPNNKPVPFTEATFRKMLVECK
jgi:hypothetical protein